MGFWATVRGYFPSFGTVATPPVNPALEAKVAALETQMQDGVYHSGDCGCAVCSGHGGYSRYGLESVEDIRLAFKLCSPLPAILNQKATYFARGEVRLWNPNSRKEKKSGPWVELMRRPNPFQGQRQFIRIAYSFTQKYGWCWIVPEYPSGFTDIPSALYVIPNWLISFETNNGKITKARYWDGGKHIELNLKEAIIIKDSASTEVDANTGLPLARVYPLESEVSNVIGALNARGANIEERGGVGLISNQAKDLVSTIPLQPAEQQRLETHFNRGGIRKGQKRVLVSSASVEFQPMLFDTEKLRLHPEHVACLQSFCNTFCFPFVLLSEGFQAKYSNSANTRRDFQDATVEPESIDWFEQFSLALGMYDDNLEFYMDYSGVASVQASQEEKGKGQKAMADALQVQWDLGTLTRNDIREEMGRDRLTDEEFNKYKWELPEGTDAGINPSAAADPSQSNQTEEDTDDEETENE